MDDIAPFKLKRVTEKRKAPWKQNPTVNLLKSECRTTERKWHKFRLQIHYQIHEEMLHTLNAEKGKARQSFFFNLFNVEI